MMLAEGLELRVEIGIKRTRVLASASRRKHSCSLCPPHDTKYVSYVTMIIVGVDETTLVRRGRAVLGWALVDGTLNVPDGY